MLNQNKNVYFLFEDKIVSGYISAIELHKDKHFGQKYIVRLNEPLIVDDEKYSILSVPETELYLTIDEINKKLSS